MLYNHSAVPVISTAHHTTSTGRTHSAITLVHAAPAPEHIPGPEWDTSETAFPMDEASAYQHEVDTDLPVEDVSGVQNIKEKVRAKRYTNSVSKIVACLAL